MNNQKNFLRTIRNNRVFTECIAEKLGLSTDVFLLKLNSPMKFTLAELAVLKNIFHFSARDTLYFFTPQVAYRNLND